MHLLSSKLTTSPGPVQLSLRRRWKAWFPFLLAIGLVACLALSALSNFGHTSIAIRLWRSRPPPVAVGTIKEHTAARLGAAAWSLEHDEAQRGSADSDAKPERPTAVSTAAAKARAEAAAFAAAFERDNNAGLLKMSGGAVGGPPKPDVRPTFQEAMRSFLAQPVETDFSFMPVPGPAPAGPIAPGHKFLKYRFPYWLGLNNMRAMVEFALFTAAVLGRRLMLPEVLYMHDPIYCTNLTVCGAYERSPGYLKNGVVRPTKYPVPLTVLFDIPRLEAAGAVVATSASLLPGRSHTLCANYFEEVLSTTEGQTSLWLDRIPPHARGSTPPTPKITGAPGECLGGYKVAAAAAARHASDARMLESRGLGRRVPGRTWLGLLRGERFRWAREWDRGVPVHPAPGLVVPYFKVHLREEMTHALGVHRFSWWAGSGQMLYGLVDEFGDHAAEVLELSTNPMRQHHGPFWFSDETTVRHFYAYQATVRYHPDIYRAGAAVVAALFGGAPFVAVHHRRGDFFTQGFTRSWAAVLADAWRHREAGDAPRWYLATETGTLATAIDGTSRLKCAAAGSCEPISYESEWDLAPLRLAGAITWREAAAHVPASLRGDALHFGDYAGAVEQVVCAAARVFVGTPGSSLSGGVLNLRQDLFGTAEPYEMPQLGGESNIPVHPEATRLQTLNRGPGRPHKP